MYETPISFGATHLQERMAFKSTANRSRLRVVREVEAIGGNVTASASREQMGYTYDALKTYFPQMVELLADSARNQVFLDWEVKEQIQKVKAEISEYANNPETLLLEAIHSAGYSGALASPLLASEGSLNRLNSSILEEFVALIDKAREHLALSDLEKHREEGGILHVHIGDALSTSSNIPGGYAGIIVDLFSGGEVSAQLQETACVVFHTNGCDALCVDSDWWHPHEKMTDKFEVGVRF